MGHAICSFITWRITIFLLGFSTTVLAFEDTSMVQKLKEKLLIKNRYDKHVRPMIHHSNTTVVKLRLTPLYLIDFDEDQSLMTMDTWLALTWDDIRLTWKKEEYDGINHLNMGDGVLWQPDIVLYNSHYSNIDPKGNTHSLVYSSGNVLWVPPATFTTRCYTEDLHLYPEDVQRCDIILGSWTQHGYQIELKLYDNETLDLSHFRDSNPRWEMLSKKTNVSVEVKYYDCCEEPYYSMKAIFYLKRKYPGHLRVVFVPCLMVMLMTLSLFWVPVLSGRKVTFGAFLFLILTLLMLYVAISTKPTSAQYYAVSFIRSMMYVVMFAVLAEVVVMNMASIRSPYRPPQLVLGFLSTAAVKVLLVWSLIDATDETDQDELQVQENGKAPTPSFRNEWIVVATALDRILFVVFGIVCIAMYSK